MKYSDKNIKLSDFTQIFTGFNYRKTEISQKSHGINFIQAKDIIDNQLFKNNINKIEKISIDEKFILNNNDILFSAKGSRNFAFLYKERYGKSVASSTFFIIRIINDKVLPEYLSWYLNLKTTQEYIKAVSTGTYIPSINKEHLGNFEIPVPSLEIQKKIINIIMLRKKEKKLLKEINSKKDILIEFVLTKKIK